ncbi:MAG: hypothetical protein FJX54_10765, partial [Alphaproteobacteria bacterium]|nr:hypothetical protein [Alphaproteobacteria bacterium]
MFELPKFQLFEKTRAKFRKKKKMAPSRPKKPVAPAVRYWLLVAIDAAIGLLMRSITWGLIVAIGLLDLFAVFVTLVVAYQDALPTFIVDFVKEYVFSTQKHMRLTLQMLNLDGIADLMRDGLKALGMLWVAVMALTFGATLLTRYVWIRRTQKKLEKDARLSGKLAPGEVLVPLHDPLVLEMNDDFSRFKHVYSFYLDLRCRSADDASRVAMAMDGLKAALSAELIGLAQSQVVQLKRDAAINALTQAAQSVTGGSVAGVVMRSSDYNRIRKPESAVLPPPPPGTKPQVKMSTSWGGRGAGAAPAPTS